MKKIYFLVALVITSGIAHSQKLKKEDKALLTHLQQHIQFLADDKLEGRRTGTKGELLAAGYISNEFQRAGIQPKGTNGYFQTFEINEGKQINTSTFLTIDGKNLELNKDYFPLVSSPNITIEALPSLALQEPGMPWFYDLKELLEENVSNPHFDLNAEIAKSTKEVKKKGATAVFLYNTSNREDGLKFNGLDRSELFPIPVIYITKAAATKYFVDHDASLDVKFRTDISEKKRTGTNVIGFIDNGAPSSVVLGAHYDHLGYGEDNNSRETEKKPLVHNGADDNASGTAALIELGRFLKNSNLKNNNFLLVAFSGEELGLYGSKYFTDNSPVNLASINYMINMDMVGRLNDSSHMLTVGGYGTSPLWGELYAIKGKRKLYSDNLHFRFDSSGTGPSDHTSFYLKNIPVLFYFTGLHQDYHKASDDFQKLNYTGQVNIVKHIASVIENADRKNEKPAFTKTREVQMTTSARFSVTLGIMPDYTFSGAGVRVDGVSENRPAQKAGLKPGDVITSLGDHKITSMESYMKALGKFKKGEKTSVVYNRAGETHTSVVEF